MGVTCLHTLHVRKPRHSGIMNVISALTNRLNTGVDAESGDVEPLWASARRHFLADLAANETWTLSSLTVALRSTTSVAAWARPDIMIGGAIWQLHGGDLHRTAAGTPVKGKLMPLASIVDVDLTMRMSVLARAIYKDGKAAFAEAARLPMTHIVEYCRSSWLRWSRPTFAVVVMPDLQAVTVIVRGTKEAHDFLADAIGDAAPFQGGTAHLGMLRVAKALVSRKPPATSRKSGQKIHSKPSQGCGPVEQLASASAASSRASPLPDVPAPTGTDLRPPALIELLQSLLDAHPDFRLLVTGHSLGAGVAALLTMVLAGRLRFGSAAKERFGSAESGSAPAGSDLCIHCFAFSCPPCVSPDVALRHAGNVTSFAVGEDPVCRLSTRGLFELQSRLAAREAEWTAFVEERLRGTAAGAALRVGKGAAGAVGSAARGVSRAAGWLMAGVGRADAAGVASPSDTPKVHQGVVAGPVSARGEAKAKDKGRPRSMLLRVPGAVLSAGAGSVTVGAALLATLAGAAATAVAGAGVSAVTAIGRMIRTPGEREAVEEAVSRGLQEGTREADARALLERRLRSRGLSGPDLETALFGLSLASSGDADSAASGPVLGGAEGSGGADDGDAWLDSAVALDDLDFLLIEGDESERDSDQLAGTGADAGLTPCKGRADSAGHDAEAAAQGPSKGTEVTAPAERVAARILAAHPRLVMPGRVVHFQLPTRPATVEAIEAEADVWFDEWQEAVLEGKELTTGGSGPAAASPASAKRDQAPAFEVNVMRRREEQALVPPNASRLFWGRLCSDYPVVAACVEAGAAESHLTELRASVYAHADHSMIAMQHCIASSS